MKEENIYHEHDGKLAKIELLSDRSLITSLKVNVCQ